MTEIPMAGPDPYQQPPQRKSSSSDCCKWGVILCVVLIIAMVLIAMIWLGGIMSLFGGFFNGGATYGERSLGSFNNSDVDLFPTYYYDEFDVTSSETQTSIVPDVLFEISVVNTGSDAVTVTIHIAIYDMDQASFDAIPTWGGVAPYLISSANYTTTVDTFINLNNYADTYTWVIWFEATSKTSTWSIDIDLTLRYNWGA